MLRRIALAAALAALAACGQPSSGTSAATATAPTATTVQLTAEEATVAIAALPAPYNAASYDAGKRVFGQCRSCHTIDAHNGNRVGPHLHGLFDRHIGSADGFTYSDALKHADFQWDAEHLDHWLASPQEFLPGNRMAFVGVRDETQRRDVIAYIMVESRR